MAISEFPKWRKYLISLCFRGKSSVRPVQVGGFDVNIVTHRRGGPVRYHAWPPPWEPSCRTRTGPLWKLTAPWTQNAPTAPWKTLCVFHKLPQGLSCQFTHEKPHKAPKWHWETRIDPAISPFKIALVGVALSSAEREAYEEKDRYARKWRAWLISNTTVPAEPFGDFIREVSKLSKSGMREAGLYLSAFSQRRAILADSSAKHEALTSLFPAIGACERAIIFTQTKHSAERAVLALQSHGIESGLLTSDLTQNERRNALAEFEEGESKAIAAPILLDEGVDVPEADLAVIIASSRSRRQMIQRMGRVIRPKTDGRMARVVVLFVEGTFEDPRGSQEAFLDLVMPAAEDVRTFERGFAEDDLLAYLNDWSPG